jgi:hypothetical protein
MRHEEFMSRLHGPRMVWLMAWGIVSPWIPDAEIETVPRYRGARTRMRQAKAAIDRLVLERARAICGEHDHGAWASCNWLCDLTVEQRAEFRAAIRAEPLMTNEKAAEIRKRYSG